MKHLGQSLYLAAFLALINFSCKTTNTSGLSSVGSDQRAREIHSYVVNHLRSIDADTEGSIWFESTADLGLDWIVQSPENYWGKRNADVPVNLACVKGSASCDPQFLRHVCSQDSDCGPYHTTCQTFLPSIAHPGDTAKKMCLGSGDSLLTRMYETMTSAKQQLDITSLSYPTGRFYEMTVNALTFLTLQPDVPSVRLLYSGYSPTALNIIKPTSVVLRQLLDDMEAKGADVKRLRMDLGWLSNPVEPRWNHAKIIVADQARVLSGGHNPWDDDYLRDRPIFDLSMEATGPVGLGVSRFLDAIWGNVIDRTGYAYDDNAPPRIQHPPLPEAPAGKSLIIGLGRKTLNTLHTNKSENASDDGIRFLIDSAKQTLFITQQDFFQGVAVEIPHLPITGLLDGFALDNLANAVKRGVHLKLAKSDQNGLTGYGIVAVEPTYRGLVEKFERRISASDLRDLNGRSVKQYICDHVEFVPWRFNTHETQWFKVDGKAIGIGAHAKLIIADSSAFSIGSQNLYPANLEEFTLLVSDAKVAGELVDNYWNPLWENSEWSKLPCPK